MGLLQEVFDLDEVTGNGIQNESTVMGFKIVSAQRKGQGLFLLCYIANMTIVFLKN